MFKPANLGSVYAHHFPMQSYNVLAGEFHLTDSVPGTGLTLYVDF